ncbi:MAG TPA: hypothetical protein VNW90_12615 [Acetobacteraceae bacterium]|jgi:hypothetical protein|nr:hypothetical protein [Acetobacteraceae bacterium]
MSAPPAAAVQPNRPDPHQDRPATGADSPSRTGRLLTLVRTLIDYGRQLASTLQQHTSATNLADVTRHFGTIDIGEILARIARGLLRAAALETRLASRLARQQAIPAAPSAPPHRQPRAARPVDRSASPTDTSLAHLPTPEDIAAEVRRRPVGAVIADICRDLGIVPSNPLWRELSLAIIENGGNLATLFKDTFKRISVWLTDPPAPAHPAAPAPHLPFAVTPGTGPP